MTLTRERVQPASLVPYFEKYRSESPDGELLTHLLALGRAEAETWENPENRAKRLAQILANISKSLPLKVTNSTEYQTLYQNALRQIGQSYK